MKKFLSLLALAGCITPGPVNNNPTPTPTPVASATPITGPTPVTCTTGSSDGTAPSTCVDPSDQAPPLFGVALRNSILAYKIVHPEKVDSKGCLKPADWDGYYCEVVANLNNFPENNVEAIVDDCGHGKGSPPCGDIAIKQKGTAKGTGLSQGYHILLSNGCIPGESAKFSGWYRSQCTPAFFDK